MIGTKNACRLLYRVHIVSLSPVSTSPSVATAQSPKFTVKPELMLGLDTCEHEVGGSPLLPRRSLCGADKVESDKMHSVPSIYLTHTYNFEAESLRRTTLIYEAAPLLQRCNSRYRLGRSNGLDG